MLCRLSYSAIRAGHTVRFTHAECFTRVYTKATVKCAAGGGQTAEPDHSPSTDERDLPAQPS